MPFSNRRLTGNGSCKEEVEEMVWNCTISVINIGHIKFYVDFINGKAAQAARNVEYQLYSIRSVLAHQITY